MPSDNNLIIRSLTNTLQREVKPEKLYDLINRMNTDLNEVFNAVFDGPLPAVDGFALLNLNAANLTGTRLPDTFRIAYLDDLNEFTRGQMIVQPDVEEPFWAFGIGDLFVPTDPSQFFRLSGLSDGDFAISQNALWNGSAFERDNNTNGAIALDLDDGILTFYWWDSVLNDFRFTWTWDGREQIITNFASDADISFALVDDNDVIHLGESAATDTTPSGWITLPSKITTEIPLDGDADNDGIICTDKTGKYLVAFIAGRRYRTAALTLFP